MSWGCCMHRRPKEFAGYMRWYRYHRELERRKQAKEVCSQCGNLVEVLHHKDENQQNNRRSNLESLCKACHLERVHIVDTDPDYALYYEIPKRKASNRVPMAEKTVNSNSRPITHEEFTVSEHSRYWNFFLMSPNKRLTIDVLQCSRRALEVFLTNGWKASRERI